MLLKLSTAEKKDLLKLLTDFQFSDDLMKKRDLLAKKIEKSLKPIKPRSAKNKGLQWQKKCCEFISELTGIEYDQKDDECEIHSRESGLNGTDIVLRGEAKRRFPFSVECKDCNQILLSQWVEQAKANSTDECPWILFIHSQLFEDKDIVVLGLDTFRKVFKK